MYRMNMKSASLLMRIFMSVILLISLGLLTVYAESADIAAEEILAEDNAAAVETDADPVLSEGASMIGEPDEWDMIEEDPETESPETESAPALYAADADPDPEVQKETFRKMLKLARELKLPINVHSRDAAKDTYDLIV